VHKQTLELLQVAVNQLPASQQQHALRFDTTSNKMSTDHAAPAAAAITLARTNRWG
jgi:hypothetical protein